MLNKSKGQLLLVLAGVFLALIIYFLPRSESKDKLVEVKEESHEGHSHEENENVELTLEQERILSEYERRLSSLSDDKKTLLFDSLINFAISQNIPPLVAKYGEQKAEFVNTEWSWLEAGDYYFKAFRLSKNSSESMLEGAVSSYEKVLSLNSDNLKAKTSLGVAYVEGAAILGEMPMKGIGMLKEVLIIDPKNVDAITNLGYFAIQSGQYDKAIERFEQVLEIDPQNAEAYIYLTDVYLSQNMRDKGIETLKKYKSLVEDPLVAKQVDDYIEDLKN